VLAGGASLGREEQPPAHLLRGRGAGCRRSRAPPLLAIRTTWGGSPRSELSLSVAISVGACFRRSPGQIDVVGRAHAARRYGMTVWRRCAFPVVNGALGRPSAVPAVDPGGSVSPGPLAAHTPGSAPREAVRHLLRVVGRVLLGQSRSGREPAARAQGVRRRVAGPCRVTHERGGGPPASQASRRQRAEERTHTTTLRTLGPMAFLISSGMYVSILGPAIPPIVGTFGGPYVCRYTVIASRRWRWWRRGGGRGP